MSRLDVKLLLEEDDVETFEAAEAMELPDSSISSSYLISVRRANRAACNAGFAQARGEYLVMYDAEDRPIFSRPAPSLGSGISQRARGCHLPAGPDELFQSNPNI